MSSKNAIGNEVSRVESGDRVERYGEFEVVDEAAERERNLRPTVEMEIVARVDTKHPDARYAGMTLAAEERARAREWEIERTRTRYDRRQDSGREARCRGHVSARTPTKLWAVRRPDPREVIGREELAVVNQQAARIHERTRGWSRAALSRRLAEEVRCGKPVAEAVIETTMDVRYGPGQVVPVGEVGLVERDEVTVEGRVVTLWEPSHPRIAQVGLLGDETGTVKFTVWKRSGKTRVRAGERVRIGAGALSIYEGRASIAVTGRSTFESLDVDRWWVR